MVSFSLLSLFSAIQMSFSTGCTFLERCNFSLKTRILKNRWQCLCNISGRVNLAVKVVFYAVQGTLVQELTKTRPRGLMCQYAQRPHHRWLVHLRWRKDELCIGRSRFKVLIFSFIICITLDLSHLISCLLWSENIKNNSQGYCVTETSYSICKNSFLKSVCCYFLTWQTFL